jgi:hypothetical protein
VWKWGIGRQRFPGCSDASTRFITRSNRTDSATSPGATGITAAAAEPTACYADSKRGLLAHGR